MNIENYNAVPVTTEGTIPPEDRIWNSCCLRMDKDATVYISTFILVSAVMGFCFYQLVNRPACSDQQAYLSVLSMILGVLLPSPIMKKNSDEQ